jgi:trigger factor
LEITLDKHSSNQASIKIKLIEADYQPKVDAKLKDYVKKAVIKGFRPGKAPISMVKNMYGVSLLVDEVNVILGEALNAYLKEQTFKILGDPLPVEKEDNSIDWKTQKEFEFEYRIGFVEGIDLKLDSKIEGTKYSIKVDEKLLNETLDNLKTQYGKSTNPEVSQADDNIYGDLKSVEGELSKTLSLPLAKVSKKLAEKFIGISKEAVVEFDAKEVKKDEWTEAFGLEAEELDQAKGAFTFTVKNINRTETAEMDQEFFDKIFGPEVVKSEEEFLAKVKDTLQSSYDRESKVFTDEELKKVLTEKAKVDLPVDFLKEWLLRANQGKVTNEDVEKEFPIYASQLTWSLISNHLAKENGVQAEHEDVIEKTKEMIREQFASSGLGSQMEASMDMFVDNYLKGNEGQNYMNMLTSVQNDKVMDLVQEKIKLNEKQITIDEFKELLEK